MGEISLGRELNEAGNLIDSYTNDIIVQLKKVVLRSSFICSLLGHLLIFPFGVAL